MKKTIKTKWINALLSGEYKQNKRKLRTGDKFCCLGVLCDLYSKENKKKWVRDNFLGGKYLLPPEVVRWAGLNKNVADGLCDDKTCEICLESLDVRPVKNEPTLSSLNDSGFSFEKIAEVIKKQL